MASKNDVLTRMSLFARDNEMIQRDLLPGDRLREDLGLDSLNFLMMITELEERYGVDLNETLGEARLETVEQLIGCVITQLEAHAAPDLLQ